MPFSHTTFRLIALRGFEMQGLHRPEKLHTCSICNPHGCIEVTVTLDCHLVPALPALFEASEIRRRQGIRFSSSSSRSQSRRRLRDHNVVAISTR